MKKTVISAAFVSLSLASKGFLGGDVHRFYDNQLSVKGDLDKAGDWYDKHSGAVDGAITTAATVGKILAGDQNDNEFGVKQRAEFVAKHGKTIARIASMFGDQNDDEFGVEQRAEWAAKHAGDIARIAGMFGDQNDDEFGVKQRAEFVAKHGKTIARIASMLGDQNDDEFGVEQRAEWAVKHAGDIARVAGMFGDQNDDQFGFKGDMDKAGDWYSAHSGAVDDAITTAAKVGKTLAGDENDDEYGIKQRADWEWKHRKAIAKVIRAVGDQNDDEFGVEQRAEWAAKHAGDIARVAGMFGDENDDQFGFKSDMDKAGDWYSAHSGAVDDAITTAAKVGKTIAGDQNDDELVTAKEAWHFFRYGP